MENIKYSFRYKEIFEEMVFALYDEDPEGESIDRCKIGATVRYAEKNPESIEILIFKEGTDIAGYAILTFVWSNEHGGLLLCIDELFVRKEWRGHGIAASFMESLSDMYPGIKGICLEVTPANASAEHLYRKLGFSETANRHMFRKAGR